MKMKENANIIIEHLSPLQTEKSVKISLEGYFIKGDSF